MRALVVEDEKPLAEMVRRGLVESGFVVDVCHDGITAQWLGTENSYDVIVLDIMLPGRNGYDVLRNLRRESVWTPVLMLTAKDGDYDQTDAFELGADDYLTKPFSFMVLVARLRALVRRGAPQRPVLLTLGGVQLDPTAQVVRLQDREVSMTAKEFALLHYLMRRAGDVVRKTEILDNVWDPAFDGSDNIVEVYIGYLRKKLQDPGTGVRVETVRGMGYRLRAVAADSSSPPTTQAGS